MDWAELIRRLLAGDRQAAALLVGHLTPLLDHYCLLIAKDLSQREREDAVELAVVDLVGKIGTYDAKRASLPTWARGFVRNQVARARQRTRELPIEPGEISSWSNSSLENETETTLDPKAVALCSLLLQLDPRDQTIIQLRDVENLSFKEIANQLGPPATEAGVRQRHYRAVQRIREAARLDDDLMDLVEGE